MIHNLAKNIFEEKDMLINADEKYKFSHDWSTVKHSEPALVVFPREREQIIEIIKLCNSIDQPFIGSGGRTGLSGGANSINNEVIISFEKMNKIIDFDETNNSIICEPGLITKNLQDFALENNLYYPIDFSSKGSSQIGGNIATNAGGIRVIKYGLTERYIFGLQAISGDGQFYNYDKNLVKDATGPNIKNIFIGSEGIFGLLTRCNIKLINFPVETTVALIGFNNIHNLNEIKNKILYKNDIEALEFFTKKCASQVTNLFNKNNPLGLSFDYYLVVEYADKNIHKVFESLLNFKLVEDIVISQSNKEKNQIWDQRMLISESIYDKKPIKFDVAVPVKNFSMLVYEIELFINKNLKLESFLFGHAGDGNLHVNFILRDENEYTQDLENQLNNFIYSLIKKLDGTISAEHGIGYLKKDMFKNFSTKQDIEILKSLKRHFDPKNLLNPEKVVSI